MRAIVFVLGLLVFSHFLMSNSCSKTSDREADCAAVACTAMFAMVTVQVKDANGQPVTFDDVYTVRVTTGEKIRMSQQMGDGRYVVLDDSYFQKLLNSAAGFRFVGAKNGAIVVDNPYDISADCCHVKKVTGADSIRLK